MKKIIFGAIASVLAISAGQAQINYSGGVYSENFDGLLNTGSQSLTGTGTVGAQAAVPGVTGWQAARVGGTGTGAISIFADNGAATTGRFYSYGDVGASERALGAVGSGTTSGGFGASFLNTSGLTYGSVTIGFNHEIWSVQGTTSATSKFTDTLAFAYGFSSSGITDSSFIANSGMTAYSALDAVSPSSNEINSVVDATNPPRNVNGNSQTYQQFVTSTITGLTWAPGETLFIRWQDSDTGGFDSGHGIDDLTLAAAVVPEPSIAALLACGLAGLGAMRRRRSFTPRVKLNYPA